MYVSVHMYDTYHSCRGVFYGGGGECVFLVPGIKFGMFPVPDQKGRDQWDHTKGSYGVHITIYICDKMGWGAGGLLLFNLFGGREGGRK